MPADSGVDSFGRPEPVKEPPRALPMVPVALVGQWDPESLAAIGAQVRETVAAAVVEGLQLGARRAEQLQAAADAQQAAAAWQYPYDPNPSLGSADAFAFEKYAEGLDRDYPGWHNHDTAGLHAELAAEANKRRIRDQRNRARS